MSVAGQDDSDNRDNGDHLYMIILVSMRLGEFMCLGVLIRLGFIVVHV